MTNSSCGPPSGYHNPALGWGIMAHSCLYYPFYIPCVLVFFRPPLFDMPCYKIMGCMGIVDLLSLTGIAFLCGTWSIRGLVYCDHFKMMKTIGAFVNGQWFVYCGLCVSLGINRAVDMCSKTASARLFGDGRVWRWVAASIGYGAFCTVVYLTPYASLIYHSGIGVFLFDPTNPLKWGLYLNTVNNLSTPAILLVSYSVVVVRLFKMKSAQSQQQQENNKRERTVALQCLIVCQLALATCVGYVILPRITSTPWVFTVINLVWQGTHGANGIIYIMLNKTIRERVMVLLHMAPNTVNPSIIVQGQASNMGGSNIRRAGSTVPTK